MADTLVAKREELAAKEKRMADILKEAGPDRDFSKITSLEGDSAAKAKSIQALDAELNDLFDGVKAMADAEESLKAQALRDASAEAEAGAASRKERRQGPPGGHAGQAPAKPAVELPFGKAFVDSAAYKGFRQRVPAHLDIDVKTLFQTTAGWAPESTRSGFLLEDAQRPIQITDLIPGAPTQQDAYKYMEETTFTNNAAEVAEAGTYGEAALALTERTQIVEKIGVWLPVTDEQLEDVAGAEAYVESRLPFMIRQRLDSQIINGDGVTPNLLGILNKPSIQTQAKDVDPVPDAIHKAFTKIMVTGRAMANAIIMHPNDWEELRLLRTADGVYIWGPPSDPGTPRIWGRPVVQADSIAEGTALAGDYANHSRLFTKRGMDIQVTNSHSTFFIEGKQAIRADIRVVMIVFRPEAFSTITGI